MCAISGPSVLDKKLRTEIESIPILNPSSKDAVTSAEYGGKACGLHRLEKIPRVRIAPWFALPAQLFNAHLKESGAEELITSLDENDNSCELIQRRILTHPLSEYIVQAIVCALTKFEDNVRLAVRSSGVVEDGISASYAGLFHTELNVVGVEEVCEATKKVWASSFTPQVVSERRRLGIEHTNYAMGVVIQQLVEASSSAVISTIVLGNGFPGIEVSANFGLGLSVVDGDVSTDSWVMHPRLGYILEEHQGAKEHRVIACPKSGVETIRSEGNELSLTRPMLCEIFLTIQSIKNEMECEIDVEVAFNEAGQMYTLQMRPLVMVANESILVIDPEEISRYPQIACSTYSLPGVVSGKLVYVPDWNALANGAIHLGRGDIALAHITTNAWSQHLANVSGLVTKEGGASSHPMLLCREKQRPCLTGFESVDFNELIALDGEEVTLDGHNRILYKGNVPVREAQQEDLTKRFAPISIRPWPTNEMNLDSLTHNKMVMHLDGKWWRKTPTFEVKGFQAEINMMRFDLIEEVLQRGGYQTQGIFHEGFVACEMQPLENFINAFQGITLEEAHAFNARGRAYMKRFSEICANFSPDLWNEYVEVYARLRTFVWMSGALRFTAERRVDEIGTTLALPQYYLEAATQQVQSEFSELDTEMQKEVHELALTMIDHIPVTTVDMLEGTELYDNIVSLADKYRFEHQMALHVPPDYNFAYKRLLTEVEHINSGGVFLDRKHSAMRRYLPDHPDLMGWLTVSIENRILQSDAHHLDARGKRPVRDALMELGGENIFEMSVYEVGNVKVSNA